MALESGIQGRITIHKNGTVSVIPSCSEPPIKFNMGGYLRWISEAYPYFFA
jgi:hypothetical protein